MRATRRSALLLALCCSALRGQDGAGTPGVNRSLLRAPPRTAAVAGGPAAGVVAQSRGAVVRVAVEVTGAPRAFRIERPGTGVVVSPDGLVATLWSLVREVEGSSDKRLVVECEGGGPPLAAELVAGDAASGLALLRVRDLAAPLPAVPLGRAREAALGDPVLVLGRPDEEGLVAFAGVRTGAQAAPTLEGRPLDTEGIVLTDARIDRRCDGAALLDARGHLLGLCVAEHVRHPVAEPRLEDLLQPSFGFALPVERLRAAFAAHLPPDGGGGAAAAPPSPTAAAVAAVRECVVAVHGADGPPAADPGDPHARRRIAGSGSGVLLTARGLCITNLHLVAGLREPAVTLADGRRFPAEVVDRHLPANLALLQLRLPEGTSVPAAPCGSDADLRLGETLLGVGNPRAVAPSVSAGVLSARRGGGRLQADPDLGNHNGGGALVDAGGCVVGIVDGGILDPIEVAFRIRGDEAKTETNLSTCMGVDAVRRAFADRLGALPVADGAAVPPGKVTAVVERCAAAMLNVYVSWTSAAEDEQQNPFAAAQPAEVRGQSLGSGVIVDASGLALTNWHVVDAATQPDGSMRQDHVVHARLFDGRTFPVRVLSISREDDLALLRLLLPAGERVHPVEIGDSSALAVGETVIAIGNPHGFANTVTAGIVTAKDQGIRVRGRWAKLEGLIETDAAINGGNSGGALLDLDGRLVGINSAGSRGIDARGYAIPVDHVRRQVLGLLLGPEKLRSPALGCRLADRDDGVVVDAVVPGGPAARAGVQAGDRVLAVDGVAPQWSPGVALQLLDRAADRPVALRLDRAGRELEVAVAPMSAAAWAVRRQTGLDVAAVGWREAPDLLRPAFVAMHRRFTGDPAAVPHQMPASAVRIERIDPLVAGSTCEVAPGDLLLAAEFSADHAAGSAYELVRFPDPAAVRACFDDPARGSYEGRTFRCWIFRDGAVQVVQLTARRLLP